MSSYFSYSSGFYNTPVSKGLLGYMFFTCTALNLPLFAHLKKYLICKVPDIFYKGEVWKLALSKLSFIDTKDFIFGGILIYYFRVFERRYGSHKFASFLVATQVLSTLFELIIFSSLYWFEVDFMHGSQLPSGPFGLIFSLFVNYYFEIPRITQQNIFGIPITGKSLTYLLGLQICSSSVGSFIASMCGLVAGLFYRNNVFNVSNITWVPKWFARVTDAVLGRLLASSPSVGPNGATLEIQRQEHIEMMEQQLLFNRAREYRNFPLITENDMSPFRNRVRTRGQQLGARSFGLRRGFGGGGAGTQPTPAPQEEHIQTLIEMGFDRERVITALQSSQNDVNTATHLLLQQT